MTSWGPQSGFNSTMVRLKDGLQRYIGYSGSVSIPQWFD